MAQHGYLETQIKQLNKLVASKPESPSQALSQLRTQVHILKDIVPGYKIKQQEQQKGKNFSKSVTTLQRLEGNILTYYEEFLNRQVQWSRGKIPTLVTASLNALADVLPAACHFNHGSQLIEAVVAGACNTYVPTAAQRCVSALEDMFQADGSGHVTLKAVAVITKKVKARGPQINPSLVASLLKIRTATLLAKVVPKQADLGVTKTHDRKGRKITKQTKKQEEKLTPAQKAKESKREEKERAHAEGGLTAEEAARMQTQLLQAVAACLLRSLEVAKSAPPTVQSRLLGPVLQGLGKFSPGIDMSAVSLLMQTLQDFLADGDTAPETTLHCCTTLTQLSATMQGKVAKGLGEAESDGFVPTAVSTDLTDCYDHLYRVIPFMLSPPDYAEVKRRSTSTKDAAETDTLYVCPLQERVRKAEMLIQALSVLIMRPKTQPLERLCGFAKRLLQHTADQPPCISMAIMGFVRQMVQKFPSLADAMVATIDGVIHSGNYSADIESPHLSNAQATVAWEWALLRRSYHVGVSACAATVLGLCNEATYGRGKAPPMGRYTSVEAIPLASVGVEMDLDFAQYHPERALGRDARRTFTECRFNPAVQEEPPRKRRKTA